MKQLPEIFGQLYHDIMMSGIFSDSKAFADSICLSESEAIVAEYEKLKPMSKTELESFVAQHFKTLASPTSGFKTDPNDDINSHIKKLWDVLMRDADVAESSSRINLPHSYIVPGGRFTEIYYWDSYFTMLGLQIHKRNDIIESMIGNFSYLIKTLGFIPNGTRSYYLNRSQPPFFSYMISLWAEINGPQIYANYLEVLLKEYAFWMSPPRAVDLAEGEVLNRYADNRAEPRPESYQEDVDLAEGVDDPASLYAHLRAAAESGWDFSSRWMSDASDLATTECADLIPVDLNALLVHLEVCIALAYRLTEGADDQHIGIAEKFEAQARNRTNLINKYCWDEEAGTYCDYNYVSCRKSKRLSAAICVPLFCEIASREQAEQVAETVQTHLLSTGGLLTTTINSGQQWDAPNAWAPLQWMAVKGFANYDLNKIATQIAERFTLSVNNYFKAEGKLMEKYNAEKTDVDAQGGEYPVQDGFGWTNGVYLALDRWLEVSREG